VISERLEAGKSSRLKAERIIHRRERKVRREVGGKKVQSG
jgi:hypothetical protein